MDRVEVSSPPIPLSKFGEGGPKAGRRQVCSAPSGLGVSARR